MSVRLSARSVRGAWLFSGSGNSKQSSAVPNYQQSKLLLVLLALGEQQRQGRHELRGLVVFHVFN